MSSSMIAVPREIVRRPDFDESLGPSVEVVRESSKLFNVLYRVWLFLISLGQMICSWNNESYKKRMNESLLAGR